MTLDTHANHKKESVIVESYVLSLEFSPARFQRVLLLAALVNGVPVLAHGVLVVLVRLATVLLNILEPVANSKKYVESINALKQSEYGEVRKKHVTDRNSRFQDARGDLLPLNQARRRVRIVLFAAEKVDVHVCALVAKDSGGAGQTRVVRGRQLGRFVLRHFAPASAS